MTDYGKLMRLIGNLSRAVKALIDAGYSDEDIKEHVELALRAGR